MSIFTTVGITGNVRANNYLLQTALSVGLQVDSFIKGTCNHKFEFPKIAKYILQNGQWVTIINSDGEPGLNLVYNFLHHFLQIFLAGFCFPSCGTGKDSGLSEMLSTKGALLPF